MDRGLKNLRHAVLAIISLCVVAGCGDEYCDESGSGIPLVGIYTMENPPVVASLDSLTVYGKDQKTDSMLYDTVSNVHTFYTPLDIDKDEVKYILRYEKKDIAKEYKWDTLTYTYKRELKFDTPECGAFYEFTIEKFEYTTHSIVYAELISEVVNNLTSETVKLYYAPEN